MGRATHSLGQQRVNTTALARRLGPGGSSPSRIKSRPVPHPLGRTSRRAGGPRGLGDRSEPLYARPMFNVSRATLGVIAAIAIVLLVLGLATDIGLFGWVLALLLGAYVVAALVMGRRAAA